MRRTVFLMLIGLSLFSCSGVKVVSDYDKSVDFNKYKTLQYYGWAKNSDELLNRFDKERIEKAFAEEFRKRGIEIVKDNADLIAALYIVTEDKVQKTATTTHMGGGYGWGYRRWGYGPAWGWGGGASYTTVNEDEYTVGTLVIAVYDAKAKKLIWQSIGKKTINENTKNREERIKRAVAAIMKDYPVPPLKK
ncbi:MAG: DUF4136 domain-containing protein [Chlorobi bacterium]|nr:DUF4136 domain-containing protein [Chlorobiota bacterium]